MVSVTFDELKQYGKCPFSYRLSKTEAFLDVISAEVCLKKAVELTIREYSRSRIMGSRLKEEKVLESFWNNWDLIFSKVSDPDGSNRMQYIKIGERCMKNFLHQTSRFGAADIISSHMEGTQPLVMGNEIEICIEEVGRSGDTAYITRYLVEPEVLSKEALKKDDEIMVSALWAMNNLDAKKIIIRWVFLIQDVSVEMEADLNECKTSAKNVSVMISDMNSDRTFLPKNGEYCVACQYLTKCPSFKHRLSLDQNGPDDGSRMASEYFGLEEKRQALKNRIEYIEAEQDVLKAKISSFCVSKGYTALWCDEGKLFVKKEKKAELPNDKTEIIARLKETGEYDSISMPNYPRLRSDIVKGTADEKIIKMSEIVEVDKIYVRKNLFRN